MRKTVQGLAGWSDKMLNKSKPIIVFSLFLSLVAAWPRIRVAVSTATPHNTPLWVARDKKIFDKHGLDVQLIFVSGGTLATQMLAAGEIQGAAAAPASLVSLIAGGEKIVMFLGISNT